MLHSFSPHNDPTVSLTRAIVVEDHVEDARMSVKEVLPRGGVIVGVVTLGLGQPGQPCVRDGAQRGLERLVLDPAHVDDDAVGGGAARG